MNWMIDFLLNVIVNKLFSFDNPIKATCFLEIDEWISGANLLIYIYYKK